MSRDLIATILDADDDTFDVELDYVVPGDVGELVRQARGARVWLDAAQDLWQERSPAAARALAEGGYSLRETATLLGLSHQRVDQILGSSVSKDPDREPSEVVAFEYNRSLKELLRVDSPYPSDVDVLLILRSRSASDRREGLWAIWSTLSSKWELSWSGARGHGDIRREFDRYRDLINASDRTRSTKTTYIQHADRFVRWLAGEVDV